MIFVDLVDMPAKVAEVLNNYDEYYKKLDLDNIETIAAAECTDIELI